MAWDWLKFFFGAGAPSRRADQTETDSLEEFRSYIAREIAAGYTSPEEALQSAIDVMSDDLDADIMNLNGQRMLTEEMAAHIERQGHWPEITDCDRLDLAFAALESKGIVSRQNFSCCGTCGSGEIWDEIDTVNSMGIEVRGYTFFHQQDTESAVEGGGLYLNYGSVEEGNEATVTIGREIQHELETHGLTTDWDGKLAMRIGVSLDWKRRIKTPERERLN